MLFNDDKTKFDSQLLLHMSKNKYNAAVLILEKEKDFYNATDGSGCTLLHFAVEYANDAIMKYLIRFGAKVDAQDHHGYTPLMKVIKSFSMSFYSTACRKAEMVNILLAANANIHLRDENGTSVWQMLSLEDRSVVRLLMQKLSKQCRNSRSIAKNLIDANCPLPIAVFTRDVKVVKLMLDRGFPIVDPKTNESALYAAIDELNADIVKIILEHGADVHANNASGYTPMSCFGLNFKNTEEHLSVLKLLLDHAAHKFDEAEHIAISAILERGNRQAISLLFRYDLDCRKKDAKGRTVLHYLACNSSPGIVEEVSSKEFDFNHADRQGLTALHLSLGRPKFMEFLINRGADVNSTGHGSSMTPLFSAFSSLSCPFAAKMETIEVLLRHGADPQVKHEERTMFEYPPYNRERELTMEPILARLVELEALGTTIDDRIASKVQEHAYFKTRYDRSHRKLVRMKEFFVNESINLFTLLTVSEKQFAGYMRNRDLAAKFVKLEERATFVVDTYFSNVLRRRLAEIIEITRLRDIVADAIFEVSGFHYDRHHIIVDNIISNFSLEELRKLG